MLLVHLRSFRLFHIALFDVIAGVVGLAFVLRYFFPNNAYIFWSIVLVLPLGVVTHKLLNIPTMLNFYLGLSDKPASLN
jgi:hypothetical protein